MKIVVDLSALAVGTWTIRIHAGEGRPVSEKSVTRKAATKAEAAEVAPKTDQATGSRLPAATIRALNELKAGKLTRHADAADLFRKLGLKLGEE